MDDPVVLAKLGSLKRCVERVREKTPDAVEELMENYDLQDILSVNLERAVQVCVDVASRILARSGQAPPDTMAGCFDTLASLGALPSHLSDAMKKAVGFRNISVHAYQEVDWDIVYSIATERLEDFTDFASCVIGWGA